ncbi:uncharacterized protein LOC121955799 [Plectropomus leopardus]|uniref:uncharacterized protein LOC121955799 n=1 Tax=Plectropomus leopardus TaxID=160734 RepID=UPI001C4B2E56|nr:uncharacterized protein LOC121955799 [Plectropomus leopardus]
MMAEFRWIKVSLFLILGLQFSATSEKYTSFIVRDGDEVTLPSNDEREDQGQCRSTTWSFISGNSPTELVLYGQIRKNPKADQLNITKNCSLVIKRVTPEDAGLYTCQNQSQTNDIYLFVVNITQHRDNEKVTLNCSVSTNDACKLTVKWLHEVNRDMKTSPSSCSATATFQTSLSESKHHDSFKCEVTDYTGKKAVFSYQVSDEKMGEDEETTMTKSTTKTPRTEPTSTKTPATRPTSTNNTTSANNNSLTKGQVWWWFIILAVVLAALFVVVLLRWKRAKGNNIQMEENTADPEDGVAYVSVSFTKTATSKTQVQRNDRVVEGDAVTYSTVKAPSSSAGASAEPSNL